MCFGRTKFVKPNLNITSKELVFFQEFKRNRIYFGTPVEVPRNFAFVITKDEKVFDCVCDKFIVSVKSLPETTQYLKLYKFDKKGRMPKFFEAEAYFVNQNTITNFAFETPSIELEDHEFGVYSVKANGEIAFRIVNPKKLVAFLLPKMGIISSVQTRKILENLVNERIARVIEKENPTARNLFNKNQIILKSIFTKLGKWLDEIGIELMSINLVSTKFPQKIASVLSSSEVKPSGAGIFSGVSFEEWQANNPTASAKETVNKNKFVTITPTGNKNGPFFKESMAPYFFVDDDEEEKPTKKIKRSLWRGVDDIAREEKSKQIVDLNSED